MRAIKITILFVLIFTTFNNSFAQESAIRGKVYDNSTGETIFGAVIEVEGTETVAVTDFEGVFSISIDSGIYTLKISYVSSETMMINDIQVKTGEIFVLENIRLNEKFNVIDEVVVSASEIRNTDAALYTVKMKSTYLIDGISSSSLKKIGDSDAAASMKRVTGVSVEGGKYVFVRGLGDRYSKTMLNGLDIPGLDPDKNTIQMDIFPTNILNNLIVYKSFSADLPADFTGGIIDIEIKDFPEDKEGNISIGAAYNPNSHFNNNYLTYEGGKTDWLGFDDGTREIPATYNIPNYADVFLNPTGDQGVRYSEILKKFNPTMSAVKGKSFMDYGIGISYGNQHPFKKFTIGYNFAFSYKSDTKLYENTEYGRYGLNADRSETDLERRDIRTGNFSEDNVFINGLGGIALKTKNSKFRIYLLHLQNGESKAGIFDYEASDLGTTISAFQHGLSYSSRSLSNALIDGKHNFAGGNWIIEWKYSPTVSKITDPDIRFTRYAFQPGGDIVISPESGFPERNWRFLDERNISGIINITKKFDFNSENAKLKFGAAYTNKNRNYSILGFQINPQNINLTGNPDELFFEENLWPVNGDGREGTMFNNLADESKVYNAIVDYKATYASLEIVLLKKLKSIFGLRYESYIQYFTGQDQENINILNNEKVLDDINFFPSLNLVYGIGEKQNLRFSYSNTIARPSMKELSYITIYDPISGITFLGSLAPIESEGEIIWDGNLQSTKIQNFDLRWELFETGGQMISVSTFYKQFDKPIEMIQSVTGQKPSIQARNVGEGSLYGVEFEIRKNLDLIMPSMKNLMLIGNYTFVNSDIKMTDIEYNSRVRNAREGQTISEYRDMSGMSPHIINAGLAYNGGQIGFLKDLEIGLYYNVQGKALYIVGIGNQPDVYSKPFHSLNLNAGKKFGKKKRFNAGLKIENILNSKKEYVYSSYNADDQYYEKLYTGIKFDVKLGYSF